MKTGAYAREIKSGFTQGKDLEAFMALGSLPAMVR
jgi:hypothetical protein